MTTPNNIDPAKILALKLSSLDEDDFDWIYERLNSAAKQKLTPLIEEIREVGLKVEPQDIDHFSTNDTHEVSDMSEFEKIIDIANYEEIRAIFESEPIQLFYYLAALKDWSWKVNQSYVTEMKQIKDFPIVHSGQTLLNDSLLKIVAKRLKSQMHNIDAKFIHIKHNIRL